MTGSGITQADGQGLAASSDSKVKPEKRSTLGTPSTSAASTAALSPPKSGHVAGSAIQEIKGDASQWIKRPRGLGVLGQ